MVLRQSCSASCLRIILLFFIFHLFCITLQAQYVTPMYEGVSEMYVLSPGVGAVEIAGRLLWTSDNGALWKDITPPSTTNQTTLTRFFLNRSHAWIVSADVSENWDSETPVHMVSTDNGGRTWTPLNFERSTYPELKDSIILPGALQFVDAEHGWFQWNIATDLAFNGGVLFSTFDGGVTWKELPSPPSGNEVRFHTPQDGWIVADNDANLEVTHDGGRTWHPKSVQAPENCSLCHAKYFLPKFQDPRNGVLYVIYADYKSVQSHFVYASYVTHDGGNSWRNMESLEVNGQESVDTDLVSFSLVGDHVIEGFFTAGKGIEIRNGKRTFKPSFSAGISNNASRLQFVDDSNGWMMSNTYVCPQTCPEPVLKTDLLTTTDGGKTFRVITPHLSRISFR